MLHELFFEFFLIGAASFGGGYGTLSLIEHTAVDRYGWLCETELYDLITIAEVTPAPIALNAASFTGQMVCGIPGAIAATLGCILPSCIITAILAFIYKKYGDIPAFRNILAAIRTVVCALIFSAFLSLFQSVIQPMSIPHIALFALSLLLVSLRKLSPAAIILLSGFGGILVGKIT